MKPTPTANSPGSEVADPLAPEQIAARFARIEAPGTGRTAYQLTSGQAVCYPLSAVLL